jgi:hypothetical protein
VTKQSDALDLEHDVFKSKDPRKIARSLKHSAEQSHHTVSIRDVDVEPLHQSSGNEFAEKTKASSGKR